MHSRWACRLSLCSLPETRCFAVCNGCRNKHRDGLACVHPACLLLYSKLWRAAIPGMQLPLDVLCALHAAWRAPATRQPLPPASPPRPQVIGAACAGMTFVTPLLHEFGYRDRVSGETGQCFLMEYASLGDLRQICRVRGAPMHCCTGEPYAAVMSPPAPPSPTQQWHQLPAALCHLVFATQSAKRFALARMPQLSS